VGYELVQVHFKPKTKLGKWSALLIIAFAVCLVAFRATWGSSEWASTFFDELLIAFMLYPAHPLGIAAFTTGLISIVKRKERSVAVYLAVGFGSFNLFCLILLTSAGLQRRLASHFFGIEGYKYKIEPVFTAEEAIPLLGL
jgi:hypothetical protein